LGDDAPPKKRFITRAISCVVVPPALAAYYIWIYTYFLAPSSDKTYALSSFPVDARYVWWSWFIISALGLNMSTYALAGVEAGMLTTRRFGALNIEQIQMHKDKTWSKISGWWAVSRRMLSAKKNDTRVPSPVWIVLSTLSVLSWVFVLSGLTMETRQTYRAGSDSGVVVVGSNITNFDTRSALDILDSAYQAWQFGRACRIPLLGALYSMPGIDIRFNMTTGNQLPSSTQCPLFLAPQAEVPVIGTAWGIALRYSCKPIHKLSDFKILSKRFNSSTPGYLDGTARGPGTGDPARSYKPPDHYFYEVPGLPNATISVLSPRPVTSRTETVAEVGLSSGIYNLLNSKTRTFGADPGGLDTEDLLEYALWQAQPASNGAAEGIHPRTDTIPELDGEYLIYDGANPNTEGDSSKFPMTAIGVQCSSASSTGWASLNGLDGPFHEFRREDPQSALGPRSAHLPRLNAAVPAILLLGIRLRLVSDGSVLIGPAATQGWHFPLVRASAPWLPPDTLNYKGVDLRETELGFLPEITTPLYTAGQVPFDANEYTERPCAEFARAENLQLALESAYRHAAIGLMYSEREVAYMGWKSQNLTSAVPWTTLGSPGEGGAPALLVVVLLSLWALGCMVLGLLYSFRKRWDAFFTTRSLYWHCKKTADIDPMEVVKRSI